MVVNSLQWSYLAVVYEPDNLWSSDMTHIFLKKWDELAETLRALLAAPSAELERRQQAMLEWRDHFWKEAAMGLERRFEASTPRRPSSNDEAGDKEHKGQGSDPPAGVKPNAR